MRLKPVLNSIFRKVHGTVTRTLVLPMACIVVLAVSPMGLAACGFLQTNGANKECASAHGSAPSASKPAARKPRTVEIEEVLSKVRSAIGYEHIATGARHVTIRSRTSDSGGFESLVETTFSPDGRFFQRTQGQMERTAGFDGKIPWVASWGSSRELSLGGRETTLVGTWIRTGYWLHPCAPLGMKLESKDDQSDVILIRLMLEKGLIPWVVEIDGKTWLPRSISLSYAGRETVINLDEYTDHGGWKAPHMVTVSAYGRVVRKSKTESVAVAPAFQENQYKPRLGPPRDARFDPELSPELEVKRAPYGGRLLVHPLVNGKDVGWFLFDTGAAGWTISRKAAKAAGLEVLGQSPTTGAAGIAIEMNTCMARSIQLGPAIFKNQIMRAVDSAGVGEGCIGLIGYGLLARCVVEYDDQAGKISVHDPQQYKLPGVTWQDLVAGQIVPTIEASFEGHTELFRVDTGASSALVFNSPCVKRLGMLDNRETEPIEAGGIDGLFTIERGEIEWIEFAGRRFNSVQAEFSTQESGVLADPYTAGIICNDLLKPFKLVLDYPHNRIAFVPRK